MQATSWIGQMWKSSAVAGTVTRIKVQGGFCCRLKETGAAMTGSAPHHQVEETTECCCCIPHHIQRRSVHDHPLLNSLPVRATREWCSCAFGWMDTSALYGLTQVSVYVHACSHCIQGVVKAITSVIPGADDAHARNWWVAVNPLSGKGRAGVSNNVLNISITKYATSCEHHLPGHGQVV